MTLQELHLLAENGPNTLLTIPRQSLPRGERIRLCGRYGPLGRICTVNQTEEGYNVVACFESQKILEFLNG